MFPKHVFACLAAYSLLNCALPSLAVAPEYQSPAKLSAMETKLFSYSYEREPQSIRLTRLEKFVFGSECINSSPCDRLARLSATLDVSTVSDMPRVPRANYLNQSSSFRQASASGYPRVTDIEQRLLGVNYVSESINRRLDRLELRAFGRTSTSSDLAQRVDALGYALPRMTGGSSGYYSKDQSSLRTVSFQPSASRDEADFPNFYGSCRNQPHASNYTVVDQIECLETATFGRIRPNKTLQKRVVALEERFYGAPSLSGNQDLTARVSQLWAKANINSRMSQERQGV
jgi:hypothetical protein